MSSYLVDHTYADNRLALKLNEWLKDDDFLKVNIGWKDVRKKHPIWHEETDFIKVFFTSPLGVKDFMSDDDFFENNIKYYTRFAIDEKIVFEVI